MNLEKTLKEAVKEAYSNSNKIDVVYDIPTKELKLITDGLYHTDTIKIASIQLATLDWVDYLGTITFQQEVKALLDGYSELDIEYPTIIKVRAKRLIEKEDLYIDDKEDCKYILEESGAVEYIQKTMIDECVDDYINSDDFKKLLDKAENELSSILTAEKNIEETIKNDRIINREKDGQIYLGFSDCAALIAVGCDEKGVTSKVIEFGADSEYYAYILENNDNIPDWYKKVWECSYWLKIYDDKTLRFSKRAKKFEIYRYDDTDIAIKIYK